jgi:hypothetical protein
MCHEVESTWKKAVLAQWRYYFGIFFGALWRNHENLQSWDSRCPGRNSKTAISEYTSSATCRQLLLTKRVILSIRI